MKFGNYKECSQAFGLWERPPFGKVVNKDGTTIPPIGPVQELN